MKDRNDAECTAAPKVQPDCKLVSGGVCTLASQPNRYRSIVYWQELKNYGGGTYEGKPCGSGSTPRESLCTCQKICLDDDACQGFEVTYDDQTTCFLLDKSNCAIDAGSVNSGEFFGKCRDGNGLL